MSNLLKQLFASDMWANARIVTCLRSEPERNEKARQMLADLLAAENIWLLRLQGVDASGMERTPELSLDECEELARRNQEGYSQLLNSLGEDGMDSLVTYRNFKGTEYCTPVRDVLMHIVLHGTYHRGQIALTTRGDGFAPVDSDFTEFVSQTGGR